MAKRTETLEIESFLREDTRKDRIYGCEEVTIGFANQGLGHEIVDFMTMDSQGIIKCYEIKVTLQDLKSNAKKSWVGHYNYLVVTNELYDKVQDFSKYIPNYVGIIKSPGEINKLPVKKRAVKQKLDMQTELMLKESLVRTLYFKMDKCRNANNLEKQRHLQAENRRLEKEKYDAVNKAAKYINLINEWEWWTCCLNNLEDIDFQTVVKDLRNKAKDKINKTKENANGKIRNLL